MYAYFERTQTGTKNCDSRDEKIGKLNLQDYIRYELSDRTFR